MDSSLKERFARLGPIRVADKVPCGSPAVFVLRLSPGQEAPKAVDATLALVKRGMTMLQAKRKVEELLQTKQLFVKVPTVEDPDILAADLATAGIAAAPVEPPQKAIDVRLLRERLGLTREQFATRFGLEIETVRNWELGRREPDTTARSYLRVISNDPEHVERAYAPTPNP